MRTAPSPTRSPAPVRRRWRPGGAVASAVMASVVASTALTGCITGERPTLVSTPAVSDSAVATVLNRLEHAESATFDATYDITPTTQGIGTVQATVHQTGPTSRDIVIGDVEYRVDGSVTETCVAGECSEGLDDAPLSNLNVTHRFWGGNFAQRLRVDDTRRLLPATGRIETIANQSAACADLTVGADQVVVYCALDDGPLARYQGADVVIELTSFSSANASD